MTPVVLVVRLTAQPGKADDLWGALGELAAASRTEPGCLVYDPCRDPDEPGAFLLYERYVDQSALDTHRETPHFLAIAKGRFPELVTGMERTLYTDVLA